MASFNISQLNSIISKLPLYQSEQVTSDLGRGLNDRAYQTLWNAVGGQYGDILNSIFKSGNTSIMPTTGGGSASSAGESIQATTSNKDTGAFKWVQEYLTPEMFVSADSCFIAFGKPLYSSNDAGTDFKIIGFCQDISLSVGVNVITIKELRTDRNIVLPLKSTPGSLSIRRLLTTSGTLNSVARGGTGWVFDTQKADSKKLFGIMIAFMSPGRTKDIAAVYAERCAITNISVPITANNFALTESVNIVFDRLKDDVQANDGEMSPLKKEQAIMSPPNVVLYP